MSSRSIFPPLLLLVAGCTTSPAVAAHVKLRPQTRTDCETRCDQLGLRLAAVVLVMNAEGCVCEPAGAAQSAAPGVAAASGAVLLHSAEEQEAERRRRSSAPAGTSGTAHPSPTRSFQR